MTAVVFRAVRGTFVFALFRFSLIPCSSPPPSCTLHVSARVPTVCTKIYHQVLTNLPVSARAFNKRGIGGWSSNVSRMNSFARNNSGVSTSTGYTGGVGGGGAAGAGYGRHRRLRGGSFNSGNTSAAGVNVNV